MMKLFCATLSHGGEASHTIKVLEVRSSKSSFVLRVVTLSYKLNLALHFEPLSTQVKNHFWWGMRATLCLKITYPRRSPHSTSHSHCVLLTAPLRAADGFIKNHPTDVQRSCVCVIIDISLPGILLRRKMLHHLSLFGQIFGVPWEMRGYFLLKTDCAINSLTLHMLRFNFANSSVKCNYYTHIIYK